MINLTIQLILGPSRGTQTITTTTTTVTSTTTTRHQSKVVKKKVKKRRRKVHRRQRTYVVEYDIDDYNNKFGIKTAKRVIRKRRRRAKKSKKRAGIKCLRRNQSQNSDSQNVVDEILSGTSTNGLRQAYPKLHLFGNKNALEYFSGESDNDEGIGSLNNSIEASDGLLIMSSARPATHRNLVRRKNVVINSTMGESDGGIDILSNIMDTMNRWHTMSRPTTIEKIKINTDGSLECNPQPMRPPHTTEQSPSADILNAPMNSRNDNGANRNFNNSNGFRGSGSNQNASQYSQNRFGNRSEQTSFAQPFQRGGNFNEGGHANNFQQDNFSPRNRIPFQRQRSNNSRLLRNQFPAQAPPQPVGLYDGEDIPQIAEMPTQCNYSR